MPRITVMDELAEENADAVAIAERAREIALELAPDHQQHRQDGDLVTDLTELADRVWDRVDDELTNGKINPVVWTKDNAERNRKAVDLGVFEAARRAYVREETYDGGDIEVNLSYVVAACREAGVLTPFDLI